MNTGRFRAAFVVCVAVLELTFGKSVWAQNEEATKQILFNKPDRGIASSISTRSTPAGLEVVVTLKNESLSPISIRYGQDPRDFDVNVFQNGTVVPRRKGRLSYSFSGPSSESLESGAEVERIYPLANFYNLGPGDYDVKVSFNVTNGSRSLIASPGGGLVHIHI